MKAAQALIIVGLLAALAWIGSGAMPWIFAVVFPYVAAGILFLGLVARIVLWARSPVPFKIPTVCGQQRSLPWIHHERLESPYTSWQVVLRMALEILLFRSLFRNTRASLTSGHRLVYQPDKLLWAGALAFHWSLLVVLLRHLRYFLQPVPGCIHLLESLDGMFQLLVPTLFVTDAIILIALLYLLGRRFFNPLVRHVSLTADYFPLWLLLGIAGTGVSIRYVDKTDLIGVKELALGLATLHPTLPQGLTPLFFTHLFLVCCLALYIPFSKLLHMGGVFLSPTRNMPNDNRARRHVNPWNRPAPVHTYAEWEDDFRDKLKAAGIPLESKES